MKSLEMSCVYELSKGVNKNAQSESISLHKYYDAGFKGFLY